MGFCWIALTLERKAIFSCFGASRSALLRPLFQVRIQGVFFRGVYVVFCDFGNHLGSLLAPFGPPFFGELAGSFRVGAKVASGVPWGAKRFTFKRFGAPF